MTDNKKLGNWGENLAKEYFLKKGYSFIANNYKSSYSEIDLIFQLNSLIVFVEVKTRIRTPESESENPLLHWQTKTIKRAIIEYCLSNRISLDNVRFDLVIILADKLNKKAQLKHYPDIF